MFLKNVCRTLLIKLTYDLKQCNSNVRNSIINTGNGIINISSYRYLLLILKIIFNETFRLESKGDDWLTYGLFHTKKIILSHFIRERDYAVSEDFQMLGNQTQHILQPRIFHRGYVVRIDPMVDVVVISLYKGAGEMAMDLVL